MRRSGAEKMEMIRLVEPSDLPVRSTLRQLGIAPSTWIRVIGQPFTQMICFNVCTGSTRSAWLDITASMSL